MAGLLGREGYPKKLCGGPLGGGKGRKSGPHAEGGRPCAETRTLVYHVILWVPGHAGAGAGNSLMERPAAGGDE